MHALDIQPYPRCGPHKQHTLRNLTASQIEKALGFPPNVEDDPDKVTHSWGFTAADDFFAIWDYKESAKRGEWSAYGDATVLRLIFGPDAI